MESQQNMVPPWEALLVIVVTFFVFLFASFAVLVAFGEAATLAFGELFILIVPLVYLVFKRVDVKSYVRIELRPRYILLGMGLAVLLLFLNIAVSEVLTFIFGQSQAVQQSNETIVAISASPLGLVAVVASLALAGICEEFAFRGFLQNSFFRALAPGRSKAIAFVLSAGFSAFIFGLFHFDPQFVYIIAAFITGLALGAIYYKWNYTASATAHATMNLIVLAMILFVPA